MARETPELQAFREKFRLDDLTLETRGGWVLSLRPAQLTLGSMVLSLASGGQDLAGLTAAEGAGLAEGLGRAERLAREGLGAERINALCLMMMDPVVHFHILPRYAAPVERHGVTWQDADYPGPPVIRPVDTPEPLLMALRDDLKALLPG